MKPLLLSLAVLAGTFGIAAHASAPGPSSTVLELNVEGLNCSLCSEEMKTKLKTIAGATDIEPRLECGKIYLDMPPGAPLNERSLSAMLLHSGFTYGGAQPSNKSIADVRKTAEDQC